VIRIYDNRFRKTNRSPKVYLECGDIVGESKRIMSLPCGGDDCIANFNMSDNLQEEKEHALTIICTPYREGRHVASNPSDFVPIIEQLHILHKEGYVHGDIRAFNTIIGSDGNSWLIDFDFGGKVNEARYPAGYRGFLADGTRLGKDGNLILKCHDWYALGCLIFNIHKFQEPDKKVGDTCNEAEDRKTILIMVDLRNKWTNVDSLKDVRDKEDVNDLTEFLKKIEKLGWKIAPSSQLVQALEPGAVGGTFSGCHRESTEEE